ncbi:MAG: hypothetical protein IJC15_09010, partial [Clostridia bacterium]|nr:hypothetical protein [Clostridia bacterium]
MNLTSMISGTLAAALLAVGAHLPPQPEQTDLTVKEVVETMGNPTCAAALSELSLRLLRLTADDATRMVSALSLSKALTLLAEGAKGETLAELEGAIGLSVDDLREALPAYLASLPSTEKAAFKSANAIWAEESGFALNEDYAARIKAAYDAEINSISFSAPGAADRINSWVSDNTDGMIPSLVNDNTVKNLTMLLVNAICFDAKWNRPFGNTTAKGEFTCADGSVVEVDYMSGKNDGRLIEADGTLGFIKDYADGAYSFVALLPDEGVSLDDYLAEMSGADFVALVES